MDYNLIDPRNRGKFLLTARRQHRWTVKETAEMLEVTTRTIAAYEGDTQLMPDDKWAALVSHLPQESAVQAPRDMVTVIGGNGAPVDVVSSDNFEGLEVDDDRYRAIIASRSVDRQTGEVRLHRQVFLVRGNEHVLRAAKRWQDEQDLARDLSSAEMAHRWLNRRVLHGELQKPKLIELKQAVNAASAELRAAGVQASEQDRRRLIAKLDRAISDLMVEAARPDHEADA